MSNKYYLLTYVTNGLQELEYSIVLLTSSMSDIFTAIFLLT